MKIEPDDRPDLYKLADIILQLEQAMRDPQLKASLPVLRHRKYEIRSKHNWLNLTDVQIADMVKQALKDDAAEAQDQTRSQDQQQQQSSQAA
jgi:hypothetical protein